MNETIASMVNRRSCRKFSDRMPSAAEIDAVVEAGLYAASGMGRQSTIILKVTNKELRDRISRMNAAIMGKDEGLDPFYGAPAILVVLADREVPTHVYDGSLTMGNLMVAAESLGLASIWIHRAKEEFDSEEGKAILAELGVEGDYEGVGHCALGYWDAEKPEPPARRDGRVFCAE
ncbi:nitroreductase [Paratractidigestivibacter sp.]|uniref:nitroreductase n=1 Tax=Paratractidigestivibacter sp. TaxID=2847316 RepID=UPI002ABE43F1|nr:nitroreductase [Paratractidigestivibacter sp.]